MAICNPRYPSNVSNITEVDDFENILSSDPTRKFNRKELSTINVLNNALLINSDLTNFPDLEDRVSKGAITDEEFADFILDKGITLDYIKDAMLEDFPVEIDYDSVKDLVQQTEDAITEEIRNASEQNNTNIPYNVLGDTGGSNSSTLSGLPSSIIGTNSSLNNTTSNSSTGNPTTVSAGGSSSGTGMFTEVDGQLSNRPKAGGDVNISTGTGGVLGSNLDTSSSIPGTPGESGYDELSPIPDNLIDTGNTNFSTSDVTPFDLTESETTKTTISFDMDLSDSPNDVTQSQGDVLKLVFDGEIFTFSLTGTTEYDYTENDNASGVITLEDDFGELTIQDSDGTMIIQTTIVLKDPVSDLSKVTNFGDNGSLEITEKNGSKIIVCDLTNVSVITGNNNVETTVSTGKTFIETVDGTQTVVNTVNSESTVNTVSSTNTFTTNTADSNNGIYTNTGFDITEVDISPLSPPDFFVSSGSTDWQPGEKITDVFNMADDYYRTSFSNNDNGFASNFNKNACGGFANPFAKLISLIAAIGAAKDLAKQTLSQIPNIGELTTKIKAEFGNLQNILAKAGGLTGVLSGDFTKLVNDIKEYADLEGKIKGLAKSLSKFQQELKELPGKIASTMMSQINGLESTAKQFFGNAGYSSKGSFKFLNKKIQHTKEFFSKNILDDLKGKVEKFFDQNTQQFEDLLPAVLNFLLLKGCGLANLLENLLRAPVDRLKSLVSSFTSSHDIFANTSAQLRNGVIQAGGMRIPPAQRLRESQKGVENWNSSKGYNVPSEFTKSSGYIPPTITPDEMQTVAGQVDSYGMKGYFYFVKNNVSRMGQRAQAKYNAASGSPGAYGRKYGKLHTEVWNPSQNFHDSDSDVDMGWKFICDNTPQVWVMLKRVSERMKREGSLAKELQVNSAYRSVYYNYFLTGGARASNHMKGMALDIGKTTILSDSAQASFIRACSEEGFIRIVAYSSFYHIDIGPGSRTSHWTAKTNMGPQARAAWNTHANG